MKAHLCLWWNKLGSRRCGVWEGVSSVVFCSCFISAGHTEPLVLELDEKMFCQHFAILHYREDIAAIVRAPHGCFVPVFSFTFAHFYLAHYFTVTLSGFILPSSHFPQFKRLWSCLIHCICPDVQLHQYKTVHSIYTVHHVSLFDIESISVDTSGRLGKLMLIRMN